MTTDSAEVLLSVRDLCVSFYTEDGLVRAVDRVSFEVHSDEILGVVGESGSGKSLSVMSIVGLISDPNVVIEGSVNYKGRELIGMSQADLRPLRGREIAVIFQDPMTALTPVYTVGWQIAEQIRAHERISRRGARKRAAEMLDAVGIPQPDVMVDRYPHQLSGGMRQRAMIAMALSCQPSLLIADEPTTALDVTVQAQILELVHRLKSEFGSSVILITHDMGVVAETADRVLVMYAGRVAEYGTTRELFTAPRHPYTWGLYDSIPPLEGARPNRLASIPGSPPALTNRPEGCAFAPRCTYRFEACERLPTLTGNAAHVAACFLPPGRRRAGATQPDRKASV
ncbi:ABC transporter ATP-binding protein [Acidihalobacter ferrooxydans]|uniref:ABC-type dipeptide transporter n=1 Tax=Acidihalobacter ferrooxydans TaxID=1765967 RepID=A0A1P8UE16_9GAMM|nr:ABC transporter ATP-binding protein [Acidihalobacter ferrooxydans]APZ42107.1 ABC transporter ATP-binding protein [Acidihalobacter ferrooxydans]